ncbi:hypothetical protein ACFL6U_05445 [Planctomycetota bacterium]
MRRYLFLTVVFLGCLVQGTQAGESSSRVRHSVIQLPNEIKRHDQIYEDINQDGLKDLVVATSDNEKRFARFLRVYYQQDGDPSFGLEPDAIIPLTPDVIAYACADTDPQVGSEILLFTANACFGYRLQAETLGHIYKIVDYEFLWQIPDPFRVFSWQRAILDVDGDHRADIFMPQSEGLRILLRQESQFVLTPLLTNPGDDSGNTSNVRVDKDQSGTHISFGFEGMGHLFGGSTPNKPLVKVRHAVHVPLFTDWNGDRKHDIVTQTSNYLHVWQQESQEVFQEEPHLSLELPLDDDGKERYDFSRAQYVLDVNRDERCDFILVTRDRNAKKLFTQILIYINPENPETDGPLFGREGIPQQLIKVAGMPGKAQLADINCDGYPDLSFVLFRPDLLDQVKTLASKSIKLQFLVYFNNKGRFSKTPDITQDVYVSLQEQGNSEFDQGRFLVDFDGDGLLDVLVRDKNTHVGLRLLKKTKNGIHITKANVWEMPIPERSQLVSASTKNDSESVLLIVGPSQIIHVRFK